MSHVSFEQRVTDLSRKHRRMAQGVSYEVGPDGLITAHPRSRLLPRFPARHLLGVIFFALVFKAALVFLLGEATYLERLARLEGGNAAEQAGAWLMRPDPTTDLLAAAMAALVP